jgi:hypothetical protein
MIRMVRRALRSARRIDPRRLRRLRPGALTLLYRKEWLYETLREERRRWAPGPVPLPGKVRLGLAWLRRDPLVLLRFLRHRRDPRRFLPSNAPLAYPRLLLARYGLSGHLVDLNAGCAGVQGSAASALKPLPGETDIARWTPEDRRAAADLERTHAWLFNDPPTAQFDPQRFPVLIYQMGKVGSTSVDFTLKASGFPHPILHVHQLDPQGIAVTMAETRENLRRILDDRDLDASTRVMNALFLRLVLREYRRNLALYSEVRCNRERIPWHIITLVRDPVAREISDFFFSLHRFPDLLAASGPARLERCLDALAGDLRSKLGAPSPWILAWFDLELAQVFGVDIYRFPFDPQRGYSILEQGNIRVLVLRLESLSQCFSEAMERFLGIRGLELINQNTAQQKDYHDLYRQVLPRVRLDAGLCRRIYDSKYCRHFYSAEERSAQVRRWTAPQPEPAAPPPPGDVRTAPDPGRNAHAARDRELESLAAQLDEKKAAIALLESKVNILLNSPSFRVGRAILLPLRAAKRQALRLGALRHGVWNRRAAPVPAPEGPAQRKIAVAGQLAENFGRHRSGLKYGLQYLLRLHHPQGVQLDAFIEKTFSWQPQRKFAYDGPWIGFIHNPPASPDWFHPQVSNEAIFRSEHWQRSLPWCRGLFAFSRYHQRRLSGQLPVPVEVLRLPSEVPRLTWSWEAFAANRTPKIVQVGWWLRRLHSIYQLPRTPLRKAFLHVGHPSLEELMAKEREVMARQGGRPADPQPVETIPFLPDGEYDRLLSRNIVFMDLYDCSACNAIVECMVRHTPLLVNPLEAVVEYLGEQYPFYFHSLEEAAAKAADPDLILRTHEYLRRLPMQLELHGEHFFAAFLDSGIYRSLPLPPQP